MTKIQDFFTDLFAIPIKIVKGGKANAKNAIPFAKKQKNDLDSWSKKARASLNNPAKANFNLAKEFMQTGHYGDAITRLKLALFFLGKKTQEKKEHYYLLAKCYLYKEKIEKAKKYIAIAKEQGINSEDLTYFHNIYIENSFNAYPNQKLIAEFFNEFAQICDSYFLQFNYNASKEIADILSTKKISSDANILELGTGSGTLAKRIKDIYPNAQITGVDFAKNMIDICKSLPFQNDINSDEIINLVEQKEEKINNNSLYHILIKKDILSGELPLKKTYDLIMARGIFNYIADIKSLEKIIKSLSKHLNKGALFCFYIRENKDIFELEKQKLKCSYPFFLNHHFHKVKDIENLFIKCGFVADTEHQIQLEKYVEKATIVSFKKT